MILLDLTYCSSGWYCGNRTLQILLNLEIITFSSILPTQIGSRNVFVSFVRYFIITFITFIILMRMFVWVCLWLRVCYLLDGETVDFSKKEVTYLYPKRTYTRIPIKSWNYFRVISRALHGVIIFVTVISSG